MSAGTNAAGSARAAWDAAADGWNAHGPQIGAWLARATDAMLSMAGVEAGARVLDVAAGAGEQTLAIARRVGTGGQVLATDLSPAILAFARDNAARAGFANVRTQVADAEGLQVGEAAFDAAVCRLGLMLLPRPLEGLRGMRRALRPGGGVCVLVFSGIARNPCLATLLATACRHAGLPLPDPAAPGGLLSLGDAAQLSRLFAQAGFEAVATTTLDAPFRLPSVGAYLDFVRASAGPVREILGRLPPAAAAAAWDEIEERLGVFTTGHGWEGPNELLLAAGRKPRERRPEIAPGGASA